MKKHQNGFTAIEGLLIAIIVLMIGFIGYYVYHSQQQANKTLNTAQADNSTVPATKATSKSTSSSTKYFTITQWGVRAPYNGTLSLEYSLNAPDSLPQTATFSSTQLDATDTQCASGKSYGGWVDRYLKSDGFKLEDGSSSGQTAAEYAATLTSSDYGHVGDYYYFFRHAQGACGSSQASADAETQTNNDVQSLVSKLQAIPQ